MCRLNSVDLSIFAQTGHFLPSHTHTEKSSGALFRKKPHTADQFIDERGRAGPRLRTIQMPFWPSGVLMSRGPGDGAAGGGGDGKEKKK